MTHAGSVCFALPGQSYDEDSESAYPISGYAVTCESDLLTQSDKKRLLSASASLSGLISSFSLEITADNGRSDIFTYGSAEYPDEGHAFPVCRMNVGRFSYARMKISLSGYSGAAVHDVYLDMKRL